MPVQGMNRLCREADSRELHQGAGNTGGDALGIGQTPLGRVPEEQDGVKTTTQTSRRRGACTGYARIFPQMERAVAAGSDKHIAVLGQVAPSPDCGFVALGG